MTKTAKLKRRLRNGKNVPANELKRVTGLRNLSATIHRLREAGLAIYTNERKGQTVYRWDV